jgi:hypothetical protein
VRACGRRRSSGYLQSGKDVVRSGDGEISGRGLNLELSDDPVDGDEGESLQEERRSEGQLLAETELRADRRDTP